MRKLMVGLGAVALALGGVRAHAQATPPVSPEEVSGTQVHLWTIPERGQRAPGAR